MNSGAAADMRNGGGPRNPRLTLYHPNAAGTGSAMQLEARIKPAGDERANCFFLEMAAQKTASGTDNGTPVPATFDWGRKVTVKLGFADLCEMLAVLEGRSDKIGGARNGLFHRNGGSCTIITLQKAAKGGGLFLGLSKKAETDSAPARISMLLSEAETVGLRCIFQTGLFFVMFPPAARGAGPSPA